MIIINGVKKIFMGIVSIIALLLYAAFFIGMICIIFIFIGCVVYAIYELYMIWIENESKITFFLIIVAITDIAVGYLLFYVCRLIYVILDNIVILLSTATELNYRIHCFSVGVYEKIYYSIPGQKDKLARAQGFRNFKELQEFLHNS